MVDNSRDTLTADFLDWKAYVENFEQTNPDKNITARFIYNSETDTLKPGNLDLAQKHIGESELVVFLDIDSTLPSQGNLLERSVADFEADPKLSFIQFRLKATNNHFNSLTQGIAISQDLARLRMFSRGYGGYKIFEGHNGIWRKTALDEIGAWTEHFKGNIIITEDILKTAHAYSLGYYGKPLNIETGEWVPNSLKALESMWVRWIYGTSQFFFKSFWRIYSPKTSLIEKFDITYHVSVHLVALLLVLITFYLQLFVPGSAANIFVIALSIIPQLISAITGYYTSVGKMQMPALKKLQHMYAGFFMIEAFTMYTQIKSSIKFALGVKQGWRVTAKGVENTIRWRGIILNNFFHFNMAIFSIGICAVSWIANYDMAFDSIHNHLAVLFVNTNVLLCIMLYGKQGRKLHNHVESAVIGEQVKTNPMSMQEPVCAALR